MAIISENYRRKKMIWSYLITDRGNTSPACASYALRKVADEIETHTSSEEVLRVKKRFDVDDCLKSKNSVDEAAQTVNELNCYCDLSAVGYGAVGYLCLVFCFAIRCSSVLERPRVAHKLEFCAATIAFKLSRLVARLVTKKLELRIAREIMARSVKKIVRCLCFSLLHQRQIGLQLSRNLRVGRHYSDIVLWCRRGLQTWQLAKSCRYRDFSWQWRRCSARTSEERSSFYVRDVWKLSSRSQRPMEIFVRLILFSCIVLFVCNYVLVTCWGRWTALTWKRELIFR